MDAVRSLGVRVRNHIRRMVAHPHGRNERSDGMGMQECRLKQAYK